MHANVFRKDINMSDIVDKIFGKKKDAAFLALFVFLLILVASPFVSKYVKEVRFPGSAYVTFRNSEELEDMISAAVASEVEGIKQDLEELSDDVSGFLDFYKWNEWVLLSLEAESDDEELAAHAKLALEMLGYEPPTLP